MLPSEKKPVEDGWIIVENWTKWKIYILNPSGQQVIHPGTVDSVQFNNSKVKKQVLWFRTFAWVFGTFLLILGLSCVFWDFSPVSDFFCVLGLSSVLEAYHLVFFFRFFFCFWGFLFCFMWLVFCHLFFSSVIYASLLLFTLPFFF